MIRVDKVDGKISIATTPTRISITSPPADVSIKNKQAKVQIETEQIQVKIDQTQCFNEAGLRTNEAFLQEAIQVASQAVAAGVDRRVAEGNTLANIENGASIGQMARSNAIQEANFNIELIPKSRPSFDFVGGNVDIIVADGYADVNIRANQPQIEVEPGSMTVQLAQTPSISIEYIGNNIDTKV